MAHLPMACGCGKDGQAEMAALLARCTSALNESGDWLPTDSADVDLLMTAICIEGYSVSVYADQWFGLVVTNHCDERVVSVDADSVAHGLAAIYLHLRETTAVA